MRKSREKPRLAAAWRRFAILAAVLVCAATAQGTAQTAPTPPEDPAAHAPVRTDSPRDTFASFLRLTNEMEEALAEYIDRPTFAGVARLALLSDEMNALLDLRAVADASRREVGIRTTAYLMDVFRRLDPIDPDALPDIDAVHAGGIESFRLPQTSIYIQRQSEGDRMGEFLFAASTISAAPRLYRALRASPLRSRLDIESFSAVGPQLTGPLVPPAIVKAMPAVLRGLWLDTPIWKVAAVAASFAALGWLLILARRGMAAFAPTGRLSGLLSRSLLPLMLLAAADLALPFIGFQINVSGRFADVVSTTQTVASHIALGWLFWIGVRIAGEWIILSPGIADASLDANLLRLVTSVVGIVGVVVILAFGGQAIGLPILSVLAGLGIGGLAVALAVRPTLENLVGGVMLYIDRPVRVGDFCRFGEQVGTVEVIGVRSTKVRALDRTLVTVPNAQFADMQIINFAHCDQMLIHEHLGLRYETSADQLRHLLAALRRMLHAHPRINAETVRVRFAGYGDFSLKVEVRVYAATREWNDFFAIREDVFLRIYDIVAGSGTGFAFPSQTLYLRRDKGLDDGRTRSAEAEVAGWRRDGALPFPSLDPSESERLRGTLDYPPRGSVDRRPGAAEGDVVAERLSAADEPTPVEADAPPSSDGREKSR